MKLSSILALASVALAAPLTKRGVITDADILQFALTPEHLENVFYKGVLDKFTKADFEAAGYSATYYTNFEYIAHDEESHVELLTTALTGAGAMPVAACTYSFPYTDIPSFITLSSLLEGWVLFPVILFLLLILTVQRQDISIPRSRTGCSIEAYLAVAVSILVTEAIHTSLQRFKDGLVAPVNAYGTSLGANEVYTLAAAFITSCPSTNPPLPFMAFPTLAATTNPGYIYKQHHKVQFTSKAAASPGSFYATFISGLDVTSVPATASGSTICATIPDTADGQTYVVLTNANARGSVMDSQIIAGPAIIDVGAHYPTRNDSVV